MHNNHAQSCTRAKPDFSSVMQHVAPCKHFPRHRKPHHNTTLRKSSDKRKSDATRVGLSDPSPSDTTYSLGWTHLMKHQLDSEKTQIGKRLSCLSLRACLMMKEKVLWRQASHDSLYSCKSARSQQFVFCQYTEYRCTCICFCFSQVYIETIICIHRAALVVTRIRYVWLWAYLLLYLLSWIHRFRNVRLQICTDLKRDNDLLWVFLTVSSCAHVCEVLSVYWPWLAAPAGAPWWPQGSCPVGSAAHTQSEPTSLLCPFLPPATQTPGVHTHTWTCTHPHTQGHMYRVHGCVSTLIQGQVQTNTQQREDGCVSWIREPQVITTANRSVTLA